VGLARQERSEFAGRSARSHTEFTRLLSEHGILGAAALVLMLVMSARSVLLQTPGWPKAFSASLVAFALIFMTGSGMRMAIPSFLLAFAGMRVVTPPFGLMPAANASGPWRKDNPRGSGFAGSALQRREAD
jgi:hypothetical protein